MECFSKSVQHEAHFLEYFLHWQERLQKKNFVPILCAFRTSCAFFSKLFPQCPQFTVTRAKDDFFVWLTPFHLLVSLSNDESQMFSGSIEAASRTASDGVRVSFLLIPGSENSLEFVFIRTVVKRKHVFTGFYILDVSHSVNRNHFGSFYNTIEPFSRNTSTDSEDCELSSVFDVPIVYRGGVGGDFSIENLFIPSGLNPVADVPGESLEKPYGVAAVDDVVEREMPEVPGDELLSEARLPGARGHLDA